MAQSMVPAQFQMPDLVAFDLIIQAETGATGRFLAGNSGGGRLYSIGPRNL
jgi:hypothetical protein